jgi:hypothetical protein
VRMCANKVVAGVRCSSPQLRIRSPDPHESTGAYRIRQFEGLPVAIPWGFESPLPHQDTKARFLGRFSL